MADGAKRLVENGFSLADVARVGAKNPAVAMGLDSEIGTLEIGKIADILVCDGKMNVERVMLRGKIL
jgi:N-acetylglucosamine-6-phosphate deacetylase